MTKESARTKDVKNLFTELISAKPEKFPPKRQPLTAPDNRGVYVICDPTGRVVHVGGTPTGNVASRSVWKIICPLFVIHLCVSEGRWLQTSRRLYISVPPGAGRPASGLPRSICNWPSLPAHIGLHQPVTGGEGKRLRQ